MAALIQDTTEEDAADLQFPKDWTLSKENFVDLEVPVEKREIFTSDATCYICKSSILEPYIRCAECTNVELCPTCFSKGKEKNNHFNNHNYIIVRNQFALIENSNWTAEEEMILLNHILKFGYGNWIDISHRLQKKPPEECKRHYIKHYIDNQSLQNLPKIKENLTSLFGSDSTPYRFKLKDIEDPPRFQAFTTNSKFMAGYNAARADFQINFDDHAELLVSKLKYNEFLPEDPYYKQAQDLQVAICNAYNNRLKERVRRKKIIKKHGLISSRKAISHLSRYESTIPKVTIERLRVFAQTVTGMEFDYILEGLHRVGEIKNYLRRLFNYRNNGLKYFHSVPMFEELIKQKEEMEKERKHYSNNIDYNWRSILPSEIISNTCTVPTLTNPRKKPPPLEISGMPDYEKLSSSEKELCSTTRLFPSHYIDFKNQLINENKKLGSLKLAQARTLLKIDVNKTRKIYDFLSSLGHINNPTN